ncbi:hypothetical protein evm_012139 [Chilo suppressalis]|nr:hypothetical protein evm_012139 [Chilo suppressalis]
MHHLDTFKDSPTAATLMKSFYVDNCVTSVDCAEDMQRFISEAKDIMQKGQFDLRCWVTGPEITDPDVITAPVLGLIWDPRCDTLRVKIPRIANSNTKKTWSLKISWDSELPELFRAKV